MEQNQNMNHVPTGDTTNQMLVFILITILTISLGTVVVLGFTNQKIYG